MAVSQVVIPRAESAFAFITVALSELKAGYDITVQNRLRGRGRCAPEDARDTQVGKTQFRWRLDEWVRIIRANAAGPQPDDRGTESPPTRKMRDESVPGERGASAPCPVSGPSKTGADAPVRQLAVGLERPAH